MELVLLKRAAALRVKIIELSMKRTNASSRVVAAGGVAKERQLPVGRVVAARGVAKERSITTVDLSTGLLGHLNSSRRYKEDIQPMDKASEMLFALKPVQYRYKKEIDRTQSRAFGLIAEDVAEVNPHLVACNSQGQPESVHYEMVNAMLLNEFLKEHRKVEQS